VKTHKLTTLLLVVVGYFFFRNYFGVSTYNLTAPSTATYDMAPAAGVNAGVGGVSLGSLKTSNSALRQEAAPQPQIADRMVIQESNLSLVVDNVRSRVDAVLNETTKEGGYMVSSSISQPEEAPFATLVVRVPAKSLKGFLEFLRGQAVKVSSENLLGTDVTDQYTDLDARLATLNKTKVKFEEILDKAVTVQDILTVQQQIISLQSQIDAVRGQQMYLEKNAEVAKITIYLSTDEYSLPYAPATPFRPSVIFKEAVRSLVLTTRSLVSKAIWIAVYSPLWLPVVLVIWFIRRRKNQVK
jgi:hypothetical protein